MKLKAKAKNALHLSSVILRTPFPNIIVRLLLDTSRTSVLFSSSDHSTPMEPPSHQAATIADVVRL